MKKLFFVLAIICNIAVSAQKKINTQKVDAKPVATQQKFLSKEQIAKKNVADLNTFTPLSSGMQEVMIELFTTKQRMMDDCGDLSQKKQVVSGIIIQKLQSSLEPAIFEKIKSNEKLFQSLIN